MKTGPKRCKRTNENERPETKMKMKRNERNATKVGCVVALMRQAGYSGANPSRGKIRGYASAMLLLFRCCWAVLLLLVHMPRVCYRWRGAAAMPERYALQHIVMRHAQICVEHISAKSSAASSCCHIFLQRAACWVLWRAVQVRAGAEAGAAAGAAGSEVGAGGGAGSVRRWKRQ